jgi:hypothetical protein
MAESTADKSPRAAWKWAVLVVACVAIGALGGRLLAGGLPALPVRYSADSRLNRAARAVVERADARGRTAVVQGKLTAALPSLESYLDREHVVRLAAECASLRRQALDSLTVDAPVKGRAPTAAGVTVFERGRLCDLLKLDAQQAQLVLYALDWPYVGLKAEDWEPPALPAPSPMPEDLAACLTLAQAAPAWPAAEQEMEQTGLTAEQAFAVRAELLRRALAGAFDADGAADAARNALGKYADLAPAQADAVLAMAGAQALARAGKTALPAIGVIARQHPQVARALREASGTGFATQ